MKLREKNVFYFFLLFIIVSPFIVYSYIFIGLELFCLGMLLFLNKKIILIKKNNYIIYFYIIPIIIMLFGYKYESAISNALKIFLSILIIVQFDDLRTYFEIAKNYFIKLSDVLIFSIFIEMIFTNIFFKVLGPVFSFLIGGLGKEMIYNNALNGIYYGLFPDAAIAAGVLIIALGLIIGKSVLKKFDYIRIILIFLCLIITGKRGPFIFALISFIYLFCEGRNNMFNLKRILVFFILSIFVIIILTILFPQLNQNTGLGRIIYTIINMDSSNNALTSGRTDLSEFALNLFYQNKLTGIGWSRFSYIYQQATYIDVINVHNVYFQLLCEVGIFGFVFCLFPFFKTLKNLLSHNMIIINKYSPRKSGLFILIYNLLYMFTGCFFDMPFYYLTLLLFINFSYIRGEVYNVK